MSRSISDYKLVINKSWVLITLVLAAVLVATSITYAQPVSPTEAMATGNRNYEEGNFAEAIDVYEMIVAAGVHDSAVYYNLGNAYFKQGDLGRAILNYRRAHRLDPRDADISANLAIARAQTLDQLEATNTGNLVNLVETAEEWLTINEASALALFLWLIICALAIVAILVKRLRQISVWAMAVTGVFLIIGLLSIANRLYTNYFYPPTVIVAQQVDVTSGPGGPDQYLVEFDLHAGAEIRQIERRDDWRRIALPGNEFQGWIPAEAAELVTGR